MLALSKKTRADDELDLEILHLRDETWTHQEIAKNLGVNKGRVTSIIRGVREAENRERNAA